jgi:hypothetical protein
MLHKEPFDRMRAVQAEKSRLARLRARRYSDGTILIFSIKNSPVHRQSTTPMLRMAFE